MSLFQIFLRLKELSGIFFATCIELGKLTKKSNVALCDWMMGWNCMRYKKKLVVGKLVEASGNLDSAADVARGSVQMFLVLCSDFLLILIYTWHHDLEIWAATG